MKRFFVRMWYWNRNHELKRWLVVFEKALKKRLGVVLALPLHARQEVVKNDPVLALAVKAKAMLDDYFVTTGVGNAKKQ